jgi:Ca2+-binding RTX toxin-like protein
MRGSQMRRKLFVENLESRRLLAPVHADLDDAGVLSISGSGKNDQIQVSVDSVDNTLLNVSVGGHSEQFTLADVTEIHIDGGSGNDWIWVDGGVLVKAIINGGNGNDRIHGGGGDDTIAGDNGNDRLWGGGGVDTMSGGKGNDWMWGEDGDDVMHGDAGNDHISAGAGNDQAFGDVGHDAVSGDDGDDILSGGYGHDHLFGGLGNDQLFGDQGKDLLRGNDGDDILVGGDDNDHLWGNYGNDILKGEGGSDHLDGGAGDNLLDGDAGRNHYKHGFVVDLDQNLVAEMTNASGVVAVATFQYVVENGTVVQKLTITVDNVPTDGMNPVDLPVTIDTTPVGSITADAVTGHGSLIFTTSSTPGLGELPFPAGVSIHDGSTITIGSDLSGSFVAAFA